jgi:integrase
MRHISNYILYLQAYTGVSFEEVLGLSWDRIDFENGTIKFDRSWEYKERQQYTAFGEHKNQPSYRTINISQPLIDMLRDFHAEQMTLFMKQGCRDKNNMVDNTAANNTLKRLCKATKTDNFITTHGSVLLYLGVDILSVSRRLGHGNIQTTMDVYLHQIDEMKARDDNRINEIMNAL